MALSGFKNQQGSLSLSISVSVWGFSLFSLFLFLHGYTNIYDQLTSVVYSSLLILISLLPWGKRVIQLLFILFILTNFDYSDGHKPSL